MPQLLARDQELIGALDSGDFSRSTRRLISFVEEIGAASLMLLDRDGRTVAATDRARLGENHKPEAYFLDALRSNTTIFTVSPRESGGYAFTYTRRVDWQSETLGVIVVEVNLQKFERAWAGISDVVLVTDSTGAIILATEPRWRGMTVEQALQHEPVENAIERAIRTTANWTALPADAYVQGEAVMRMEGRVAFRGWRIASFTPYAGVREKVNGFLALEIMGFAILLALAFYFLNRKTASRMVFLPA